MSAENTERAVRIIHAYMSEDCNGFIAVVGEEIAACPPSQVDPTWLLLLGVTAFSVELIEALRDALEGLRDALDIEVPETGRMSPKQVLASVLIKLQGCHELIDIDERLDAVADELSAEGAK